MEDTMRFIAILLALLSCAAVSHAQSMSSHLAKKGDVAALNAAVADIAKFSSRQTEALARAMANCWNGVASRSQTDRAFEVCAESHRYFILVTDDEAPVRQVYDAWYIARVVKGAKDNKQNTVLIHVEQAFSAAIRKRFDTLDQEVK
jgi:hypothetical protein